VRFHHHLLLVVLAQAVKEIVVALVLLGQTLQVVVVEHHRRVILGGKVSGAMALPQAFLGQVSHMLVVAEALEAVVLELVALEEEVVERNTTSLLLQLLELPTQAEAAAAETSAPCLEPQEVPVSSSSPTQAQHNYLVVELLPNQAVTSFTHSHLLAHLALCHL
jgi:hypothetical protein